MKIQSRIAKAVVAGALGMLFLALLVLNLSSGERKIDHRIAHLYSGGDAQFVRTMGSEDYFPGLPAVGDMAAQVLKSSSTEGSETVRMMYLLSIAAASQSVLLSNSYFVPDDLSVRMLAARKASRSRWGDLLRAGVQIYDYQPTMYHVKVMIVDEAWASVGSTNFDNRSFRLNDEPT